MRNALFAVGLVAASFAGGAVVNGPGLGWAKTAVLNHLGGGGDGDPGDVPVVPSNSGVPGKPIPPLVLEPSVVGEARDKVKDKAKDNAGPTAPSPAGKPNDSDPALPGLAPVAEGSLPLMEATTPAPPVPDGRRDAPAVAKAVEAPRDEPRAPAALPAVEAPAPLATSRDRARDAPPNAGDEPRPAGTEPPVRLASIASGGKADDADAAGAGDWADVRRQLRALGVSRYGLEGDPSGRVRFHCVIPPGRAPGGRPALRGRGRGRPPGGPRRLEARRPLAGGRRGRTRPLTPGAETPRPLRLAAGWLERVQSSLGFAASDPSRGRTAEPSPPRQNREGSFPMADRTPAGLLLIVTGSTLRAEEVDRPLAYYLKQRIEESQAGNDPDGVPLSVRVVADFRWIHDEPLQALPTISVGGPGVNALAHRWLEEVPVALAVDERYYLQMDPDLDEARVSVWGMDNATTQLAVSVFIDRFLPRFLEHCAANPPTFTDPDGAD